MPFCVVSLYNLFHARCLITQGGEVGKSLDLGSATVPIPVHHPSPGGATAFRGPA